MSTRGADGVHQIARLIPDLKHSALQQCAGGQAVGGVVVRGLLGDLNLCGDGCVLPLNEGSLARLDIHRFHLGVGDVPLVLQLPQVVAPTVCQILNIDVAGIVRGVLSDGLVGAVIEQEADAVDALSGDSVRLDGQKIIPQTDRKLSS